MSPSRTARHSPEIESEITSLLRQEKARQTAEPDDVPGKNAGVIRSIAQHSVAEIDRIIAELTDIRDHLDDEATRVAAELAEFCQMGRTALISIGEIAQSIGRLASRLRLDQAE
jgi:hypothetical protein